MKAFLVATAFLAIAGTSAVQARDVTSDPDATMTTEQKLGPNVHSQRFGNRVITTGTGWRHPRYAYYHRRHWR
jgi:hypothetical protein